MAGIFLESLGWADDPSQETRDTLRLTFENALFTGRARAAAITAAIEFAAEAFAEWSQGGSDESVDQIAEGVRAWQSLPQETGLDLVEVYRRRELAPVIMVPRHVARRYGEKDLSLHKLLQQAQEAYVFGVPFACIALMRSILEMVLREHYHATGLDLNEAIGNVRGLPRHVGRGELHRIRQLANGVLHVERARVIPQDLEPAILRSLSTLRNLIEAAP